MCFAFTLTLITCVISSGLCAAVRAIAKRDNTQLLNSIYTAAHANSSAIAYERASQPYLSDAIQSLVGDAFRVLPSKMAKEALPVLTRSTVPMQMFLLKMSDIYILPASTAVALSKSIICLHSLLWFVLNLLGVLAWKYYPLVFVNSAAVLPPPPAAAVAQPQVAQTPTAPTAATPKTEGKKSK